MPTPLATPETRTWRSERSSAGRAMVVVAALRRESVVIIAVPKASQPAASAWRCVSARRAIPSRIRSTGSRVPIRPVDAASVSSGSIPSVAASAMAMADWSSSPAGPVAALAQPLVTTMARTRPPDRARCRRLRRTGAAWTRLAVKTAAAVAGSGPRHDDEPEVRPAAGLDARAKATRAEAGRQLGALLDPRAGHG